MAVTGTCPFCKRKHVLKKCTKCGTTTCGSNAPCGNGWCPVCHGKLELLR